MALQFTFDPARRLIIEPGYYQSFSAALLSQVGSTGDAASTRQLWFEPIYGTLMLKPLQLQPDFLNHPQQLTSGCVLRLSIDYVVDAADIVATTVFEQSVGTASNPWIFHTPATPASIGPSLPPIGIAPFYNLNEGIAGTSESGSASIFEPTPGGPAPGRGTPLGFPGDVILPDTVTSDLRLLVGTQNRFPANQGFFFRWYYPDPKLTGHQTIYGFSFGQYFFYCRPSLLEIWRDISPAGDRSKWAKQYSDNIFAPGSLVRNLFNPSFAFGTTDLNEPPGEDRCLMVIPYRQQHVMILSNTGKGILLTALNNPRRQPDGINWDITRSDSVDVWALTGVCGRFQIQKVKYEPGPATLKFSPFQSEYTPIDPPALLVKGDTPADSISTAVLQNPTLYTFPRKPQSNDVPPPTTDGTGRTRTYGLTLTLTSSTGQNFSPEFYAVDVIAQPSFMDNPATPTVVSDVASGDSLILSADLSIGSMPGDGHMTAYLEDQRTYPLTPYYFRAEAPVDLVLSGTTLFSGYTERIEVQPLRLTGAPRKLTVHAVDKWLLLEGTFLRDQRDYKGVGHITTVDTIAMQSGIDTIAQPAEYPAGWNGANAAMWDTPLGTPIILPDNEEGNQLLGWKPQIMDTAANYLRRIQEGYSGWLMGFRSTGRFFYLPFDYFQGATVQFFAHENMGIMTGLALTAGVGLNLNVSAGTGSVMGTPVSPGAVGITLTDNSTNHLYMTPDGMTHTTTMTTIPDGTLGLGTALTAGGAITNIDQTPGSGRQLMASPTYRHPVEHRTIEPSGNVVQVLTKQMIDLTANQSGLYVDWASVQNPAAPNYLGRYKMFKYEAAGAHTPSQLNAMAYIVFKQARRKRKRISIYADFVPGFEVGHVATVQGYGDYRMVSMQGTQIKGNWHVATYVLESTERGY